MGAWEKALFSGGLISFVVIFGFWVMSVCCSEDWLVNGGDSVWELPFS